MKKTTTPRPTISWPMTRSRPTPKRLDHLPPINGGTTATVLRNQDEMKTFLKTLYGSDEVDDYFAYENPANSNAEMPRTNDILSRIKKLPSTPVIDSEDIEDLLPVLYTELPEKINTPEPPGAPEYSSMELPPTNVGGTSSTEVEELKSDNDKSALKDEIIIAKDTAVKDKPLQNTKSQSKSKKPLPYKKPSQEKKHKRDRKPSQVKNSSQDTKPLHDKDSLENKKPLQGTKRPQDTLTRDSLSLETLEQETLLKETALPKEPLAAQPLREKYQQTKAPSDETSEQKHFSKQISNENSPRNESGSESEAEALVIPVEVESAVEIEKSAEDELRDIAGGEASEDEMFDLLMTNTSYPAEDSDSEENGLSLSDGRARDLKNVNQSELDKTILTLLYMSDNDDKEDESSLSESPKTLKSNLDSELSSIKETTIKTKSKHSSPVKSKKDKKKYDTIRTNDKSDNNLLLDIFKEAVENDEMDNHKTKSRHSTKNKRRPFQEMSE